MPRRAGLLEVELWDGRRVWCAGLRDGLPWWTWGTAPTGLLTRSQLREQQLRRHAGQDPVGLLVFRRRGCGEQVAELFRVDEAVLSRTYTPAVAASVEAMCRAHRTCRRCRVEHDRYLPTSTWMCGPCMTATGNYGGPAA